MRSRVAIATTLVAAGLAAGCGEDEPPALPDRPNRPETAHELPKLERGWEPYVSRAGGYAFGRAPGWAAEDRGLATVLRAPDELVVATITVDRTDEAQAVPLPQFAVRAFTALPGFEGNLDPSEPRPFRSPYDAVQVTGRASATATGVPQRLRLIVLRRGGFATVTTLIAENADVPSPPERAQAIEMVRTLRTRPVAGAPN